MPAEQVLVLPIWDRAITWHQMTFPCRMTRLAAHTPEWTTPLRGTNDVSVGRAKFPFQGKPGPCERTDNWIIKCPNIVPNCRAKLEKIGEKHV